LSKGIFIMITNAKQILFIDNDPHLVRSVPRWLRLAGYEVVVARNSAEAEYALAHELFQLAIIDIRVDDDHSDTDTSGFVLARRLPATVPCIFHTAHDTKENIHEALGRIGADDIIAKDDPEAPQKLLARVEELFHTSVGINFDLVIENSPDLSAVAGQLPVATDDLPQPTAQDLMLILRRLFREADAVQLTPLVTRETISKTARSSALLFIVQERRPQGTPVPVVLKLGDAATIAAEAEAYHRIKAFLGGQRRTQLEGEAYSRAVGGLVYSLIGAAGTNQVQPLADLFVSQPATEVAPLLERFFQTTFGQIHADAKPATLDLMEHYTAELRLTAAKLQCAAQALDPALLTSPTLPWSALPQPLPNPIYRVLQGDTIRSFGSLATQTCLCHGDLHSHNVLVDEEQHFWLIDFARATQSHSLRDFAELETDIKFRALPSQPLADFIAFESALVAPTVWEEEPTAILLPTPLQQAFDLVTALRRIARQQLTQVGANRAYQQALFWHTLNVMRLKTVEPERKRQALVAAALLLERHF
jgi:DNA-binding response OmpR family regulator